MNNLYVTDVSGLQHGDEGKGKIIDYLLRKGKFKFNLTARYNGGGNAGHTIYHNNKKLVFHHFPIGTIYGIPGIMGPGCVFNIEKGKEELKELKDQGFDIAPFVKLDHRIHLVSSDAISDDIKYDKIGSTGSGIGPTHARKAKKKGVRIENRMTKVSDPDKPWLLGHLLGCEVINSYDYIHYMSTVEENGKKLFNILLEGAQGVLLDPDIGTYPYCTSGTCTIGATSSLGFDSRRIYERFGIAKLYQTYVGNMKFQSDDPRLNDFQIKGKEFGATTGRKRQCNWLNLNDLARAIEVQGVTTLIFNKVDIVEQVGHYVVIRDGKQHEFENINEMKKYIETYLYEMEFKCTIMYSSSPYDL